ncbi:MAG TPA: flagellar hook capping FlgD N-terminal domain-containing protein [Terriglobia bacterium]|jgi:flagellar basal-body rod modification protein FlgD|nr:flagellar hook capping FlgD N-terminal domain-containing protein [Terriglobia bacterium]
MMTSFNPMTTSQETASMAGASSAGQSSAPGIQAKQITTQDFMTLLTAQLQNQDPTNPVDPTEFVTQLAQFTTLDEVSQINSLLQTLVQSAMAPTGTQGASGAA